MEDFRKRIKHFMPIKYYFATRILMIIIPILVALTYLDYVSTRIDMQSNFVNSREQGEKSILHGIRMAESAYTLYSSTLDTEMKKGLDIFLKEYEKSGRDPEKIDLFSLKEELGGKMDLYVIDDQNVVTHTTYETDLNLDFDIYPELAEYLDKIRKEKKFSSQRITPEIRTGKMRKYAYIPTPDDKYILELGLVSDEFPDIVNTLDYMRIARELSADYPYLSAIRVFDMNGHLIGNPEIKADRATMVNIRKVARAKKNLEIPGDEKGLSYSYLYVRSEGEAYQTESTRIVECVWNTLLIDMELRSKLRAHLGVAILAIIGSILITFYTAGHISHPINQIVKDVGTIARGNLEHKIEVNESNELKILEYGINIMVDTIKDNMEKIKHYSENLEKLVKERTVKLEEANEQLELFVFSVTHDLRAPLGKIEKACDSLLKSHRDRMDKECLNYAEAIMTQSQRMDKLIMDLLAYGRMSRSEIQLDRVETREVIHKALSHLEVMINERDAEISIKGDIPPVFSHGPTLEQIFSNLISNSIKYVAPDVKPRITIQGEVTNGTVKIFVKDNGIGIEPEYQDRIFLLFERLHGEDKFPGTGVGLAIVKKGINKMGGRVGVDSTPGEGSRFWIELKKVPEDKD